MAMGGFLLLVKLGMLERLSNGNMHICARTLVEGQILTHPKKPEWQF
jgi:hypothetical protein